LNFGRALPAKDPLARWVAVLSMALNDILLTHKLLAEAMLSHPHRLLTPALEFHPHRLLNRPLWTLWTRKTGRKHRAWPGAEQCNSPR